MCRSKVSTSLRAKRLVMHRQPKIQVPEQFPCNWDKCSKREERRLLTQAKPAVLTASK